MLNLKSKLSGLKPVHLLIVLLVACIGTDADAVVQKKRAARKKGTSTELAVSHVNDEKGKFKCIRKKRGENHVNIMMPVTLTSEGAPDADVIEGMLVQEAFGEYGKSEAAARKFLSYRFTPSFELWDRGVSISPYSIGDGIIQFRILTHDSSGNSDHEEERYLRCYSDSEEGIPEIIDFVNSDNRSLILNEINAIIKKMNADSKGDYYQALTRADHVPDSYRFDKDGVTFWFCQGDISAMAFGPIYVTVPYEEIAPFMPAYMYNKVTGEKNTKYYPLINSRVE